MKKIVLFIIFCFLISCESSKSDFNPVIIFNDKEDLETVETVEVVEYLEAAELDLIIRTLNKRLLVVDIQEHHILISQALLKALDSNQTLEAQEDMIKEIILDYLEAWKYKELQILLIEEDRKVDEDDVEEIIKRSSIMSAYTLMLSYETIELKKQFK